MIQILKWQDENTPNHDIILSIMTSSNGSIFRVTGPFWGKSTGHRWISLHKGQWRGALMFSLICAWKNGWANNRYAGDLRRHDVTVMQGATYIWIIVAYIHTYIYICIYIMHTSRCSHKKLHFQSIPEVSSYLGSLLIKYVGTATVCQFHQPFSPSFRHIERCIKRPLNFVVSQERWSLIAGRINKIL